jgi:hypothetical protein
MEKLLQPSVLVGQLSALGVNQGVFTQQLWLQRLLV